MLFVKRYIERIESKCLKAIWTIATNGKALMLPVAILPAAGLLLAIGTAFQGEALQQYLPFIKIVIQNIANMMTGAGGIILITYLSFCTRCSNRTSRWRWCSSHCSFCRIYYYE